MPTRNQRIVLHVTHAECERLAMCAKEASLSLSEFIRQAALEFTHAKEEQALNALINAAIEATDNAERAIDDTLRHVARSNARIKRMEAGARRPIG
jgi:hypothetical protein